MKRIIFNRNCSIKIVALFFISITIAYQTGSTDYEDPGFIKPENNCFGLFIWNFSKAFVNLTIRTNATNCLV